MKFLKLNDGRNINLSYVIYYGKSYSNSIIFDFGNNMQGRMEEQFKTDEETSARLEYINYIVNIDNNYIKDFKYVDIQATVHT